MDRSNVARQNNTKQKMRLLGQLAWIINDKIADPIVE